MRMTIRAAWLAVLLLAGTAFLWSQSQNIQITQGPKVENTTDKTAVIAWSTNVQGSTVVKFGTDQNNLNQMAQAPWGGLTHRVTLRKLQPGTTYYFTVDSGQAQGTGTNTLSQVQSFTTQGGNQGGNAQPQPNDAANNNSQQWNYDLQASCSNQTATSFDVTWTTGRAGSSRVNYGTDPNNMTQFQLAPWGETNHKLTIDNLKPGTTYYLQAQTESEQGNGAKEASKQITCTTRSQ